MAETTKIAWAQNSDGTHGATFNPWIGCTRVSAGCAGCYAEKLATARLKVEWGKGKPRRRTSAANWKLPRRLNRKAAAQGIRIRVFCASLADVFDAEVPGEWRADLWRLIRETPFLEWIIVTKRPENMATMLPADWGQGWPNVWLVVTVEDQKAADSRIPILLSIPAKVRGLSMEPLLGPVQIGWALSKNPLDIAAAFLQRGHFSPGLETLRALDWVIVGGESGPKARSMDVLWLADILDACQEAKVPVFVKQMGRDPVQGGTDHIPNPADDMNGANPNSWPRWLRVRQMPQVSA